MRPQRADLRINVVEHVGTDIARQRANRAAVVQEEAFTAHPDAPARKSRKGFRRDKAAAEADALDLIDVRQTDVAHQPRLILRPDQRAFAHRSAHGDLVLRIQIKIASRVSRVRIVPVGIVFARRPSHAACIAASTNQNAVPLRRNNDATVASRRQVCGD